jgi:hypothetical protein
MKSLLSERSRVPSGFVIENIRGAQRASLLFFSVANKVFRNARLFAMWRLDRRGSEKAKAPEKARPS